MKLSVALPILITALLFAASCASAPIPPPETSAPDDTSVQTETPVTPADTETAPVQTPPPEPTTPPVDDIVVQFDNVTITKQTFKETKTELEVIVNDLNRITFSRDYNAWLGYLSPEYRKNFSDPAVLAEVSANLPIKGVQLKSIKDYFNYVFVPSRQNMRVDDIQFVSPTRVYVIMEISPGNPAAIYIIEKFGNDWKLVTKN